MTQKALQSVGAHFCKMACEEKSPLIFFAGTVFKPRNSKILRLLDHDRGPELDIPHCSPGNAVTGVTLCHQGVCSLGPH